MLAGQDDDETRLGIPEDDAETRLGIPPSDAETKLGIPADDAETQLGISASDAATMPGSRPVPSGASRSGDRGAAHHQRPQHNDKVLVPGEPFGSRYHIIRVLGAGGMGVVFQAWDAELGVTVALKVIRPEVTSDPYMAKEVERRFKRELLLAREVTHNNVVRIHDLGEIDGIKYITMSYVDGQDLASILAKERQLSPARTLVLIRGVVSGLRAAHEAGVVHRDLKPANIMVDAHEQARIMDFGIARSTSQAAATTEAGETDPTGRLAELRRQAALLSDQTLEGAIIGTVEYMAPEQAQGKPVDQRVDIYALGLIVYDMLGGLGRAARSDSAISELTARMQEAPPSIRTINPEVPEALEAVIGRCLQPDPAARYQTTRELETALDRLDANGKLLPVLRRVTSRQLAAAAALMVSLLGGTWWAARGPAPVVELPPTSVLISDFDNRSGDPAFDGALEQTLATALERASFITVYPRRQAQQLAAAEQLGKGGSINETVARLISRREGIKVVVTGELESTRSGYRVTVRAIDPVLEGQGLQPLATATADANSKDTVLNALAAVAADLRADLGDTTPESERAAAAQTFTASSLDAVRAYVRGQELNRSGKPREALVELEKAVALDPKFGMAYVQMASSYTNLKMEDKAKANYEEAFKHLDHMTDREKYRSRGVYYFGVVRNYKEAIKTYETLVQQYPADNTGYANLALAHIYDRNIPKAIEMGRKAIEIYPRDILQRTNYATYSMYGGDFPTAVTETQRVLKENPTYEWANLTLALSLLAQGDESGARAAYTQLAGVSSLGASLAAMGQADLEMFYGRYARALGILNGGIALDEKEKDASGLGLKLVAQAEAYLARGNKAAAVASAERATRTSDHEAVLVPAAHVLTQLGKSERALELARGLEGKIPPQIRSYAGVIKGDVLLHDGRIPQAIDELQAAEKLHDSWVVHTLLGQAYQAAEQYPEAQKEWELCVKRRGEAADVFIADTSSMRYLAPAYYWLGRAQEKLGGPSAGADSYRRYLDIRKEAEGDPLVAEARKRAPR
jgi:serine/threonine protein kinase/predicted Zn-dependent protease